MVDARPRPTGGYDGDLPATLALAEPDGPTTIADTASVTTRAEDGRLTGRKLYVADLTAAQDVAVVARDADGLAVYAVATDADGVTVTPRSTMDRSRRYAELVLDGAPGRRVGDGETLATARRRALALLACEAVGVAQRALDTATEHAKTREAFSRPIGTFQAVSHQVADMFTAVQLARSLAYWAAWAVDADDERADLAVAAAKSAAAEAAVFACEHAIQVLGGVGFTWEHFLHRFYKRAQWIDAFEGYAAKHRADIAADYRPGHRPRDEHDRPTGRARHRRSVGASDAQSPSVLVRRTASSLPTETRTARQEREAESDGLAVRRRPDRARGERNGGRGRGHGIRTARCCLPERRSYDGRVGRREDRPDRYRTVTWRSTRTRCSTACRRRCRRCAGPVAA